MQLDELTDAIKALHAERTDVGLAAALLTGRDACISSTGPFEIELVGAFEVPEMHGREAYVRYTVARSVIAADGTSSGRDRHRETSDELSEIASAALRNPDSSEIERRLAGSVLAQDEHRGSRK